MPVKKTLKNANLKMYFANEKVENETKKSELPAQKEETNETPPKRNSRSNAKTVAIDKEEANENTLKLRTSRSNVKTEVPVEKEAINESALKRRNSRSNPKTETLKQEKENDENPPKRRSARLTRNTSSMAEDTLHGEVLEEPEEPKKKLPFIKYTGSIKYYTEFREIAESSDTIMQWVEKQTDKEIVPVSFDMEWPFSFQTGPGKSAVIQICVEENCCYVFQLSKLKTIPPALLALLNHPKVRLHGVNIKSDFRKLARDFSGVDADALIEKCVDLGVWFNRITGFGGRWSLERLANVVTKKGIDKNKKIRMSKWHVIPLDETQLMYASIDVYIGHIIYQDLEKREKIKLENEKEFLEKHGDAAFKAVKALGETFVDQNGTTKPTKAENVAKSVADDIWSELQNESMDE